MKISKKIKNYKVEKYTANMELFDCGRLPYEDVKRMLKGYKYDDEFEMYFSKAGNIAYSVTAA